MFSLGCLAFAPFFLSDFNDLKLHSKLLIGSFPLGAIALAAAILMQTKSAAAPVLGILGRIAIWAVFASSVVLLARSLFFSFPAAEAYGNPGNKRGVRSSGLYAICRHPGVIFLSISLFCLSLVAGFPLYAAIVYSLFDIALVAFEDKYVFPRVLSGYEKYKNTTPFLIPTPGSIKTALGKKAD
jgi:protein-S-isoprenylcysteine O-methyltransferase Ste14